MGERKFKPSGKEVAKLIERYLREIYPELAFTSDDVSRMVVPSELPGSDVKFLGKDFAAEFNLDQAELINKLYQKLTGENEKGWYDRVFYGMLKGTNLIRFRLVDDSTT